MIEVIAVIGWACAIGSAYMLFMVSRSLGESAAQNKRLLDEIQGLQMSVRFWKSMAFPPHQ